ncbi:M18 family aminopeptidase [Desulfoluna sp.]|uniref:M18 family aminopeptidase n=1 Tax=Desulfoluna sp. TaxID=2045199 RepID=UPI00260676D2|nr:M18 family aminopeptidase [Desulfoluna sp.]
MNKRPFNEGLLHFLGTSPTPFHAVASLVHLLEAEGFQRLHEKDRWTLQPESRYVVTRNDSSLIAFTTGRRPFCETGLAMGGAHTDSPCLKVKPVAEMENGGGARLGVEVYGSPLLTTWFDRDLSLAGRITTLDNSGNRPGVRHTLIDMKRPVAIIPNLAIHLDREANKNRQVNPQTELPPLIAMPGGLSGTLETLLRKELTNQEIEVAPEAVLEFELSFYDTQLPALTGYNQEFITGARIDNLLSCFALARALARSTGESPALMVLNDHEEVGSQTPSGASGNFLVQVLERLIPDPEERAMASSRSLMISSDNAHALHPAHPGKYDPAHSPRLNQGPAIKYNANQRYATSSTTAAYFKEICRRNEVPVQAFAMRNDMPCGSTIGPITAAITGIPTLDVGVPMLAMHSIRETAGCEDAFYLYRAMTDFFQSMA